MTISPTANASVQVPVQGSTPAAQASATTGTPADTSTSAQPTDTVTISDAGRLVLANGATTDSTTDAPNMQDPQVAAFYSQIATVMDTSGKTSQEDQLSAYVSLWNTMEAGFPQGLGTDAGQQFEDAMSNSSVGQQVSALNSSFDNAGVAAFQMGNSNNAPTIAKAQLAVVNGWSDFQKEAFFQTSVNEKLQVGGNHFGSVGEWISSLQQTAGSSVASTTPSQAAVPVGLTDEQNDEVAEVIGAGKTPVATKASAPATTDAPQLSTTAVDAKTALAQGIVQLLTKAQQTNDDTAKAAAKSDSSSLDPTQTSLADLIAEMEKGTPQPAFTASPKPDSATGSQLNQQA